MKVVGIIGAGTIAELFYVGTLRKLGYHHIVVYDQDLARAKQLASTHNLKFALLNDLLKQCDTVFITSPVDAHALLLMKAMEAENVKHVVCEKPFLTSLNEFQSVYKRSIDSNTKISVAHIRRIFPGIDLAHQHLQKNEYGNLISIQALEGSRMSYQSKSNYLHQHPLGGVLFDAGSHVIDSILYILNWHAQDTIEIVDLRIHKDKPEPSHQVALHCTLNHIPLHLKLSRTEPLANKIVLQFEKAKIDIPLGIKPNIIVTANNEAQAISSTLDTISYMSEAFAKEFYDILNTSDSRWDVATFKNTTAVLSQFSNSK